MMLSRQNQYVTFPGKREVERKKTDPEIQAIGSFLRTTKHPVGAKKGGTLTRDSSVHTCMHQHVFTWECGETSHQQWRWEMSRKVIPGKEGSRTPLPSPQREEKFGRECGPTHERWRRQVDMLAALVLRVREERDAE